MIDIEKLIRDSEACASHDVFNKVCYVDFDRKGLCAFAALVVEEVAKHVDAMTLAHPGRADLTATQAVGEIRALAKNLKEPTP